MLIFVNGSYYRIFMYYVNQAFIILRKELWMNSVKDLLNTITKRLSIGKKFFILFFYLKVLVLFLLLEPEIENLVN